MSTRPLLKHGEDYLNNSVFFGLTVMSLQGQDTRRESAEVLWVQWFSVSMVRGLDKALTAK